MIFQSVNRIFSSTNCFHISHFQQTVNRFLWRLKLSRYIFVNLVCVFLIKQIINVKVSCQFQVSPVEQRISQSIRNCFCPSCEFFFVRSVSGDEFFIHAHRSHCSPFVMIATNPNLSNVLELTVFCNLFWRQMVVIIDDRLFFCKIEIQLFSEFIL